MKTMGEIRRANMKALVDEFGTIQSLADAINRSHAQTSQWLHGFKGSKTGKPRGIGDNAARHIEKMIGKPRGWMDAEHGLPYKPKNRKAELAARLIDEMESEEDRTVAIKIIAEIQKSQLARVEEIERRLLKK